MPPAIAAIAEHYHVARRAVSAPTALAQRILHATPRPAHLRTCAFPRRRHNLRYKCRGLDDFAPALRHVWERGYGGCVVALVVVDKVAHLVALLCALVALILGPLPLFAPLVIPPPCAGCRRPIRVPRASRAHAPRPGRLRGAPRRRRRGCKIHVVACPHTLKHGAAHIFVGGRLGHGSEAGDGDGV